MKTSIKFRLGAAICAAILFVSAVSFISVPVLADSAAEKATAEAEKKAKEAKEADDAVKAADAAVEKADEAAEAAGAEADKAADAAEAAKQGKDKKAQKEADAAKKSADEELARKEKDLAAKEQEARDARRRRRLARRAAKKAIRLARKLVDEKFREGAKTEDLEERLKPLEGQYPEKKAEEGAKQGSVIPPSAGETVQTRTANGLNTVTFDTLQGRVTVNLPDDIRAGDTISGTVITEPKGQTKEEQAKNQSELNGLVIEIDNKRVEPFSGNPQKEREGVIQQTFWIYHVDEPKVKPAPTAPATSRPVSISLVNSAGKDLAQTTIPIWSGTGGMTPSGAVITPDPKMTPTFNIPTLGQTGKPIVITGPFDGNSSNTTLTASALRTTVQDFEKNTENVSGGFGLLAEAPGRAVVSSSENVTGPIQITLKEGNTQTTGTYRNIGVKLTAPKTSLLKGERTTLRVEVSGLQGIKEPVPLTLESRGVITMEGGTYQPLTIQPSQVGADGRYSTTRGITGVQAGGWGATATVVTTRSGMGTGGNMPARTPIMAGLYHNEQDMNGIDSVEQLEEALKKQGLRKGDEATCKRLEDTKVALCTRYTETSAGDTDGREFLEKKYQIVRQVMIDYGCAFTWPETLAKCPK